MESISYLPPILKGEPPLYKVVKVFRDSARRIILAKNLSKEQAMQMVRSYPDHKRSMVVFFQQ